MSDIHDPVEEEIKISPFMQALDDWRHSSKEERHKYAAGVELEVRKLIMGGISHIEAVRNQIMAKTFQPFQMPGQSEEQKPVDYNT